MHALESSTHPSYSEHLSLATELVTTKFLDDMSPHLSMEERNYALSNPSDYGWYTLPKLLQQQMSKGAVTYTRSPLVDKRDEYSASCPAGSRNQLVVRGSYRDGSGFPSQLYIEHYQPVENGYDRYHISISQDAQPQVTGIYWKGGTWHTHEITDWRDRHTVLLSALWEIAAGTSR